MTRPHAPVGPARGLIAALLLAGCATGPATSSSPSSLPSQAAALPVIVDTDLGNDDIFAIAYIARQPDVELLAVTVSGTGLVHCGPGLRVARSLLDAVGATSVPIGCGRTDAGSAGHPFPDTWREAADVGFGVDFPLLTASEVGPVTAAADLIAETVAAAGAPVTILHLGPFTNLADALAEHPDVTGHIERVVAMAGAIRVDGNVTPEGASAALKAEWNVYADPVAAKAVFAAGIPLTLVPLDATNQVPLTAAFAEELAKDHGAAPADIAYELAVRHGTSPGEYLWDTLAAVALVDPSVVSVETLAIDVEAGAGPMSGATVVTAGAKPISVATGADAAAFAERLFAGLRLGPPRAHPFTLAGTIALAWDGSTCTTTATGSAKAGVWSFAMSWAGTPPGLLAVVRLHEGSTIADLRAYQESPEAKATTDPPSFVDVTTFRFFDAPGASSAVATLDPATYAPVCIAMGPSGNLLTTAGDGLLVAP